jgi:hypothetical protein
VKLTTYMNRACTRIVLHLDSCPHLRPRGRQHRRTGQQVTHESLDAAAAYAKSYGRRLWTCYFCRPADEPIAEMLPR